MTLKEYLDNSPFEDIQIFSNYSYDDAFIGVSHDGRAVYDFDKMVKWLMEKENWSQEKAEEWIEYNTIRSLPYFEGKPPIVIYPCEVEINDTTNN